MDGSNSSSGGATELVSSDLIGPARAPQSGNDDEAAAVTMQKNYRGYRLRRQLADCAVIAKDYRWWNVLEGVCLQKTTSDVDKHEDAPHRWRRIGKNAAKLGKGLSKDATAIKLAFQHWLEAIDPRHRYGHNLTQYYNVWLKSGTTERFFYWLDVGAGRQVDLKGYPRSKLCKEQISYLGPRQREKFEASIVNGVLRYNKSGELIDTSDDDGEKWIFVMSTTGKLYIGQKKRGEFQHSSFLAGGAAKAAGRLLACNGVLKVIEPHSGHYRPTEKDFKSFQRQLESKGVDLSKVKIVQLKDKATDEGSQMIDFADSGGDVSNFADVVEALINENDEGASTSNVDSTLAEEEVIDNKKEDEDQRAASERPKINKRPSFNWTSEGGARLSSLSIIPHEQLTKALDEIGTPRSSEQRGTPRFE